MIVSEKSFVGFPSGELTLKLQVSEGKPKVLSLQFEPATTPVPDNPSTPKTAFKSELLSVVRGQMKGMYATDALVRDLRRIAGCHYNEFFDALRKEIRGRTRNHIARSRRDVYPQRPELGLKYSTKLADGWYLGTNINTGQMMNFLDAACKLKGVNLVPLLAVLGSN